VLAQAYSLPAGPGSLEIDLYTGFSYADKDKYSRAEAFAYDDLGFDLGYGDITAGPLPSKMDSLQLGFQVFNQNHSPVPRRGYAFWLPTRGPRCPINS
jgi:hypothetical protein